MEGFFSSTGIPSARFIFSSPRTGGEGVSAGGQAGFPGAGAFPAPRPLGRVGGRAGPWAARQPEHGAPQRRALSACHGPRVSARPPASCLRDHAAPRDTFRGSSHSLLRMPIAIEEAVRAGARLAGSWVTRTCADGLAACVWPGRATAESKEQVHRRPPEPSSLAQAGCRLLAGAGGGVSCSRKVRQLSDTGDMGKGRAWAGQWWVVANGKCLMMGGGEREREERQVPSWH